MLEQERVPLLIPKGELYTDVIRYLQQIGFKFDVNSSEKETIIPVPNIGVDLCAIRANDIPDVIGSAPFGITGSDLIWERGWKENSGRELEISKQNPHAKNWRLYIGITHRFAEYIRQIKQREPLVSDIADVPPLAPNQHPYVTTIATEYPHITRQYLEKNNIPSEKVPFFLGRGVSGSSESMQHLSKNCNVIVTVISSGASVKKNDIEVLHEFHEGTVRMINAGSMLTDSDRELLSKIEKLIGRECCPENDASMTSHVE
ncbi:MAG TPA: hypothetical protein VLF89_03375 [Candidatus Saccharimonadales bacterium]|nr:hypothetical protein [Candidatus Saccharimonadales bacterium]